ncbi:protein SHORT HYPOCOTYL IN WHITE LIGHT 1 [Manihot esculenta]|uniref:Uncharacterized protein n=1 Tax=Manihot esculenta TaxID=3983 RepID=A0A2C9V5U8_MANES|nr:protein SHORT HYPOCOTYL IN WHITE LIGHT 1 [Manihot esculenta]OAY39343.1 hypothetical protein MANES_10G087100v8 [Manihot esculenta]
MSFTVTLSSPISFSQTHHHRHRLRTHWFQSLPKSTIRFLSLKSPPPFLLLPQASRRNSSNNTNLVDDPRNWSRSINNELLDDEDEEEEDDEDEEEDRSLDLLVRFVENVFKKVSKRARKAVRSVLPASISTKLVGFSVNGVLILACLWVLKAFLEVVCTLGSVVFASILLIRGIWAGITYLQENRYLNMNEHDDDHAWTGTQPAN